MAGLHLLYFTFLDIRTDVRVVAECNETQSWDKKGRWAWEKKYVRRLDNRIGKESVSKLDLHVCT